MSDRFATTVPAGPEDAPRATLPVTGKLGRFMIVDLLGQGGMGIVLGAYDPDLDRKVALKLLHAHVLADGDAAELSLREARAMAKLSHPNVLTVHEVGSVDGRVFIAMELAAGGTLRAWLAAERRSWRDVLHTFIDAGRGLAAAHAAGLVHRDFKPENVLLTKHGRVCVADFGLVSSDRELLEGVAGTPAYMAPEQRAGRVVGPAADQYAFCVSLWEALFGARPGAEPVEPERGVPAWLPVVLARGLRDEPAERWPSVDALLVALQADPDRARRRRRRIIAGLGAGTLALVVTAGATWRLAATEESCEATSDRFAGVWDANVKTELVRRVHALGKPFLDRAFAQIAHRLDEQRGRWEAMRKASCEATRVRKEQSDVAMDQRAECLERRFGDLQSFVAALDTPSVSVLDQAVDRATFVGDVSACADVAALAHRSPLPTDPKRRLAIVELERELAVHRASVLVERPVGRALLDSSIARARALDYAPVTAVAQYTAGLDRRLAKDHAEARRLLQAALLDAEAGGDDMLRFEIEVALADVVGAWLEKFDEGLTHGERAAAVLKRVHSVDPMLEADLRDTLSSIQWRKGDFKAARELAQQAVATSEKLRPHGVETAAYLLTLAIALDAAEEWAASKTVLDRALAIAIASLGPDHPKVARILNARGGALRRLDKLDEADADYNRALAIFRASYGDDAFEVGVTYTNLGSLQGRRNDFDGAADSHRKTIAIFERHLGPNHSRTLVAHERLGGTLSKAGRHEEAVTTLERVIAGQQQSVGKDHPWTSNAHFHLGMHYLKRAKQPAKALVQLEEARRALVASQGAQSRMLSRVYSGLGDTYTELGRHADAAASYELSLARLGDDPSGEKRADLEKAIAEARAALRGRR